MMLSPRQCSLDSLYLGQMLLTCQQLCFTIDPAEISFLAVHSPGILLQLLSLGTGQELSHGNPRLQHLQAWGTALPEPLTPPETAARAGGQSQCVPKLPLFPMHLSQ